MAFPFIVKNTSPVHTVAVWKSALVTVANVQNAYILIL